MRRRVLFIRDLGTLGGKLEQKAAELRQRTGERVSTASVARRLLEIALNDAKVRRRAGLT